MSGRLHIFLRDGQREKLHEMADALKLSHEDLDLGYLLQESFVIFYGDNEAGVLPKEFVDAIKEVPAPTARLARKIASFMREGTIKRLDRLEEQMNIVEIDNAHGHLLQLGFEYIFGLWKAGKLDEQRLAKLSTVVPPKVVYHK